MGKNVIRLTESELKNIIKESVIKILSEGQNDEPNGTHYAIHKPSGKILFSWDYSGYDGSELRAFKKDYFYQDLIDMEIDPKNIAILTRNACIKRGIDPSDDLNWTNNIVSEAKREPKRFNIGGADYEATNVKRGGAIHPGFRWKDHESHNPEKSKQYRMRKDGYRYAADYAGKPEALHRNLTEAFSDLVQTNHIMANNKDIYDAYVLIDNYDESLLGTYNHQDDAIEDAQDLEMQNKYGSYTVVGCVGNEYDLDDEKSVVYRTK